MRYANILFIVMAYFLRFTGTPAVMLALALGSESISKYRLLQKAKKKNCDYQRATS